VLVVVMGVTGAGKTTIGQLVAAELGVSFRDADDLHPPENRRKMAAGTALTERDRKPWLQAIAERIPVWQASGGAVLACSALRVKHRKIIQDAALGTAIFVFLDACPALIRERLATRTGHYMPASLLESQFETLEPPGPGCALSVRADRAPGQIAQSIVAEIRRTSRT
jgi:carbohydrate kinase (thermoresistant glucokinase family)